MLDVFKKELAAVGQIQLYVRIFPGAARSFLKEQLSDGSIKIAIKAPPENGKANNALCMFLAQQFNVHHSCVQIISGLTSRHKLVRIKNQ